MHQTNSCVTMNTRIQQVIYQVLNHMTTYIVYVECAPKNVSTVIDTQLDFIKVNIFKNIFFYINSQSENQVHCECSHKVAIMLCTGIIAKYNADKREWRSRLVGARACSCECASACACLRRLLRALVVEYVHMRVDISYTLWTRKYTLRQA